MSFIYMSQQIITLFVQSMVNNSLYQSKGTINKDFNQIASLGLLLSIFVAVVVVSSFWLMKDIILNSLHIDIEAKNYALEYLVFMLPFFILYNIFQYFVYILYAINKGKYNLILVIIIILCNVIFNYSGVYLFHWGVKSIALASCLSVIVVIPIYYFIISRNNIQLFTYNKLYFKNVFIGIKNLGFASILEPLLHQGIQFIIMVFLSKMGQEMLSAKTHAHNFLTIPMTISIAFGIVVQLHISTLFGANNIQKIKEYAKLYIVVAFTMNIIITASVILFVWLTIDFYSASTAVLKYLLLCLFLGIIWEPSRCLSIVSKATLRGLQYGNYPLLFSLINKVFIVVPLLYVVVNFSKLSISGVIIVECIGYILNFCIYYIMYRKIMKKGVL